MRRFTLAATAACAVALSFQAHSATYVLHASKWGSAQDKAVAAAGGSVTFKHGDSGVAVVEADSANFLSSALSSGAIIGGALDLVAKWTPDLVTEEAVNPLNDTYYASVQWAPQSVGAPAAWAAGYTGAGVRVAIVDGGIYASHVDLAAGMDVAASRSFVPGAACQMAFNCDTGTFWHGTHVAGIVGARDNATGIVGIAPDVKLIGVKVLHNGTGSFASVIQGILYAATPVAQGGAGADIMNLSLGTIFQKNEEGASSLRIALKKAIDAASKSTLVVVAAGNDGMRFDANNWVSVPAESGSTMSVAATGPVGYALGATDFSRIASYSNYGHTLVDIAGPGGDAVLPGNDTCVVPVLNGAAAIANPCWVFDMVLSTSRGTSVNGGYTWAVGTSMAAPAVAAVAALVKQKYPGITVDALQKHVQKTATRAGTSDATHGAGYVNAAAAVAN